jgi:hypothetical protein
LERVLALLDQISFLSKKLERPLYTIEINKKKRRVSLVQKTYHEMHSARNHFLHGNPVQLSALFPARNHQYLPLTACAVLVYKGALMAFLGMSKKLKEIDILQPIGPEEEKVIAQTWYKQDFERALLNMRQPRNRREAQ